MKRCVRCRRPHYRARLWCDQCFASRPTPKEGTTLQVLKTVGEIPQWLSDRMMESDDPPPCLMAAHMILVHEMTRMIREANTLQAGKRAKWMDNPPAEIPHDVHVEMTGPREGR